MVGGFSTNHAIRSGTNLQLCSRYLIVVTHASGITIQESRFRECENKTTSLMFSWYAPNKPTLPEKTGYGLV